MPLKLVTSHSMTGIEIIAVNAVLQKEYRHLCRRSFFYIVVLITLMSIGAEAAKKKPSSSGSEPLQNEFSPATISPTSVQKREQSSQKVGMTIHSLVEKDLKKTGSITSNEIASYISNVEIFDEYGEGQPVWEIRGVGVRDFNANNTPTAAMYIDDIYQGYAVMGSRHLFDTERVQVVKGPMGALYGRNTTGGAVLIESKKPSLDENNGYLMTGYNNFEQLSHEGATNLLLSEHMAVRVSGFQQKADEGWQTSLSTHVKHGKKNNWGGRVQLLMEPHDDIEVLLKIHHRQKKSDTVLGRSLGLYKNDLEGELCEAFKAGDIDESTCVNTAFFSDPKKRKPDLQNKAGTRVLADPINEVNNRSTGASAIITLTRPDYTFKSITGYDRFNYQQIFDYDGGQNIFGHQDANSRINTVSQELRLQSLPEVSTPWLIGVEFTYDRFIEDRFYLGRETFSSPLTLSRLMYKQFTHAWSVYGQLDYELTDRIKISAGLRYSDEDKEYRDGNNFFTLDDVMRPGFQGSLNAGKHDHIWSSQLRLEWQRSENKLWYASLSHGYKSGGFFGGAQQTLLNTRPYQAEKLTSLELGIKSAWLENNLFFNTALFFYDYRNLQGETSVITPSENSDLNEADDPETENFSTLFSNQGNAFHKGLELEFKWLPTKNLTLFASAAWLDAEITDSDVTVSGFFSGQQHPLKGTARSPLPHLNYRLATQYEMLTHNNFLLEFSLSYHWRGQRSQKSPEPLVQVIDDRFSDYGLVGARVALSPINSGWELALWGENLANSTYITNVTTDDVLSWQEIPGTPRSFGIRLHYQW